MKARGVHAKQPTSATCRQGRKQITKAMNEPMKREVDQEIDRHQRSQQKKMLNFVERIYGSFTGPCLYIRTRLSSWWLPR